MAFDDENHNNHLLENENSLGEASALNVPYIFGTSVIGPSHVLQKIPCQDFCNYEIFPSGWGVIAIADGLGSAKQSDLGARTAVTIVVQTAKNLIDNDCTDIHHILKKSVSRAREALEAKSIEEKCELRDLACTIIVIINNLDTLSVVHIGDGAVVAETKNGLVLVSGPEESEYANEVVPLTSDGWEESLRYSPLFYTVRCVAAFTDGCQRAALRKTPDGFEPHKKFFNPLFSYARELKELKTGNIDIANLLVSQKINENSDDDKTLVISVLTKENSDD